MLHTSRLDAMRRYFSSGTTLTYDFRIEQLKKLKAAIIEHEQELFEALHTDLKKSPEESWVTEVGMVLAELNVKLRNLKKWMRPERVRTNLLNMPSTSYVYKDPWGVVLIIGPWNYPFQLLINPLLGAIAAGNCVVLKPSEFAPATSAVMKNIIEKTFPPDYILYAEGDGAKVIPELMQHFHFDHVFYTGSTEVGRLIYKMAAEKLVAVTLELGGKSPCIVEDDANIKVAAKRIAVTKFSNAGQMCVAPDYLLVHESRKEEMINELRFAVKKFYGDKPEESYNYGKVINQKQFSRLVNYLNYGNIAFGGNHDDENLYIEPTVLTDITPDSPVMEDEIFGPILPLLTYKTSDEAKQIIALNPNPLALYIFTSSKKKENDWLHSVSFGGGCVNNASWHLTNHNLPFGGRGFSGIGQYHGQHSFETFSHKKSVMKTPTWFDPAIKYPPFKGKLKLFKRFIK